MHSQSPISSHTLLSAFTLLPLPCIPGDEFDSRTIQSASAFLLNAREYTFLSGFAQPFKPGRVAPRLACALTTLQEKGYMRKPIRDLFETGEWLHCHMTFPACHMQVTCHQQCVTCESHDTR